MISRRYLPSMPSLLALEAVDRTGSASAAGIISTAGMSTVSGSGSRAGGAPVRASEADRCFPLLLFFRAQNRSWCSRTTAEAASRETQ